ncbi:hypothetical protein K1719_026385 [Acacia pycnantha]|nr:hypothetical protein K1719_026385 [Acacia pycnantha]
MNCLETFVLSGCSNVRKLPKFGKGMERLSRLDLEETTISKLPQSLVNLTGLSTLNLYNCKKLVCFPSDFQKLKAIKEICITGCSRFSRLPENLNENEALELLYMGRTAIKEVPPSLTNLKALSLRGTNNYAQLSSSSWNRCSLLKRAFRLQGPSTPTTFLSSPSFSNLSSLVRPHFQTSKEFLSFFDCPTLKSLPQLPSNLSTIHAGACPLLKHYVRSQLLWEFIEQFESQTQLCHIECLLHGWKQHILKDYMSLIMSCDSQITDFFMQPTRLLVISGSEVPSWFHNQNYFCAEDFSYALHPPTNVSFIVNEPDSFCLSEWWGIAVCLVLENDLESANLEASAVFWAYRVSKGKKSEGYSFQNRQVWVACAD